MNREAHDVVIVGGGIIGISLAYFLAKEGCDVCVVDRGVVGQESSGRCAGNIGQSHRPLPDLPIMTRAVRFWKKLSEESELDFQYRQHGNLRLAWNDKHAEELKAMVEKERANGLECRFLDRADTKSIVPYVTEAYAGSVYTPSDGSAEPYLSCVAVARAAKRAGAVIHEHREVTGIDAVDGKISGIQTANGPIAARVAVNAAGAWSPAVGAMLGVRIPAVVRRSQLVVTEQLPRFMEPVVSTVFYGYFRQTLSGNVLIGYPAASVKGYDRRVTYEALSVAAQRTATIVPRLRGVSVIRAFTGFTTWTPDLLPVVGPAKAVENLYVATAFCGLGFAIGPGIGEMMAELIIHGKTSAPIDAYRLDRFEQQPDAAAG